MKPVLPNATALTGYISIWAATSIALAEISSLPSTILDTIGAGSGAVDTNKQKSKGKKHEEDVENRFHDGRARTARDRLSDGTG